MRIVALGDSTTAGTPLFLSPVESPPDGFGDEKSQFSYWLMQRQPAWTVLNAGVNGERTDQIAGRFDRDVLAHAPQAVIILAGVNDVYQGQPTDGIKANLGGLYDRAARAGLPIVAATIVPYNTATAAQNAAMHDINAWIEAETRRRTGMAFADTRRATSRPDNPDLLLASIDGLHPDVDGYRRMADAIAPALERLLADPARS